MESQKKKPVVPILVGLLVIAVVVIVALVVTQKPVKQVTVPDLAYKKLTEAEAELAKVGLKVGTVTEEDDIFGGFVIRTNPEAGKSIEEGSAVDIVASKGEDIDELVTVPNLTGMTPEEAEETLNKLWIMPQPGSPSFSDSVEAGRVCAQSVAPGTKIGKFDTVTYSVSQGTEQVTVPDITGKTITEARDILSKAGLGCDTITTYSDTVAKDVVIGQNVAKGQNVSKGTIITAEVSLGKKPVEKVKVPNIISYTLADALKALNSAGLGYTYSGDEDGTVITLKPVAGTEVEVGSMVEFELRKPQSTNSVVQQQTQQQTGQNESEFNDGL